MLLQIRDLCVSYGIIEALQNISFDVKQGSIVALLGANGAGKSTLLRTIMGLQHPVYGEIRYRGEPIQGKETHLVVRKGVALVPEGRRVFPDLTVSENLRMGAYLIRNRTRLRDAVDGVLELFPKLRERTRQLGGTLSGGEQQMLAIARALVLKPDLLLLDEPSLGLAPVVVEQVFQQIVEINKSGTTILLVEQNAYLALETAHRAHVLQNGRLIAGGEAKDLLADPSTEQSYLGA